MHIKKLLGATALCLTLFAGVAGAAGLLTNGLPTAGGSQYPSTIPLTGNELVPADTQLAQGLNPASEAISVTQLKGYFRAPVVLTDVATVSTNALQAELFTLALATSATLDTPSNLQSGQSWKVAVTQSGGAHTLGFTSTYLWSGGTKPTISTTAGAIDLLTFTYDGTHILSSAVQNLK